MRHLDWNPPNYRCSLRRRDTGEAEEQLLFATAEDELRRSLEAKYLVDAIEPYDFEEWLQEARAETKNIVDDGKPPAKWRSTVWGKIKQFLYSISHGHCGYCETTVLVATYGEVEHYRPKGRVEEEEDHPGYFWLAYDIDNYIPTCPSCNTGKGKRNFFPIKGTRAKKPDDDLKKERPQLLHPFRDPPAKHLTFIGDPDDPAYGMVAGRTPRGKKSVEVYRLNRGALKDERRQAMEDFLYRLRTARREERRSMIQEIEEGLRPYSAALLAALMEWVESEQRELTALRSLAAVIPPVTAPPPAPPP